MNDQDKPVEDVTVEFRGDADQLDLLTRAVEDWNSWRIKNPTRVVDLKGADLSGANLRGADLRHANLDHANLTKTRLDDALLESASLAHANLHNANLSGADLWGANLFRAKLDRARAAGASFGDVDAQEARFGGADMPNSYFGGSNFKDADLREAQFHGSDLRRVEFAGAILWTTQFNDADLRNATNMRFNETVIRNTKFSPRSRDRWSTLRRYYTGPRYAITLLFLLAFILPYFAKAAGWVAAARSQEAVRTALERAEEGIESLDVSATPDGKIASTILSSFRSELPNEGNNILD